MVSEWWVMPTLRTAHPSDSAPIRVLKSKVGAQSYSLDSGAFRLDLSSEQLWKGSEAIEMTPKAWAVLRYFLERPGQLVTKGDLLDAVWGEVAVGEGSLTKVIFELRSAFGDTAQTPRFIQTVHRRGFRFIAPLEAAKPTPFMPPHKTGHAPVAAPDRTADE